MTEIEKLIEEEAEAYANNCDLDFTIESEESLNEYHKIEIKRAFKKGHDIYRSSLKVDKPISNMIHLAANARCKESGYSGEDEEGTNCYLDFKAGASFILHQNRWRKVEEELPEVGIRVIVKTTNNNYVISEMYIPKDCHGTILGVKEWKGSHSFKLSIIEWKPIE